MGWPMAASALTFDVENEDGVLISYITTTDSEVSVYYRDYSGRVVIPSTVVNNGNSYSVTGIASGAFRMRHSLSAVVIPPSVTEIGQQAFTDCEALQEVELQANVSIIPLNCFYGCTSLKSITLPSTVTAIQSMAFANTGLEELVLPSSLEAIGQNAFHGCENLQSVTIPESVNTIGQHAFASCVKLSEVKSYIRTPFVLNSVFFGISPNATLYVPAGIKAAYEATAGWDFANIVEMGDGSAPVLSASDITLWPNENGEMSVCLQNGDTKIIALQFELTLPEGISKENYEGTYSGKLNRDRCPDFKGAIEYDSESGKYIGAIYSETNQAIVGSEGPVVSVLLRAGANVASGNYQGKLNNITLVKEDHSKIYPADVTFAITVNSYIKGDCNGDGSIDVADITEIIKYIVHRASENFNEAAADMDEDGVIDVADITLVVKAILEAGTSNARMFGNPLDTADELALVDLGNGVYAVNLKNLREYTASQFDIRLSAGMTIASMEQSSRSSGHQLCFKQIDDDIYRVIVYSQNNNAYTGNEGTLITFQTQGGKDNDDVCLENTLFVDTNHTKVAFGHVDSTPSSIVTVSAPVASDQAVYTLDGKRVEETNVSQVKGIYVVNGKKIIKH